MRRKRIVGPGLAALALAGAAGCDQAEEPVTPPPEPTAPIAERAPVAATYVCDSGLSVAVAWPDSRSAQVTWRDRTWVLRAAPAASGARFVNAEVEWRTATRDGVERATLSRLVAEDAPVVLEQCSQPAPAAPVVVPATGPATPDSAPAAPAAAPCKGPQLRLSNEGGDAGAGNRVANVGLQNIGAQACSLTGYPAVTLHDGQGRDLTTVRAEQAAGSYFTQGQVPAPVTLAPREKAAFELAWTVMPDEAQGERACPSAARVRVTAPGDTSPVSLDMPFTPCGGRVRVSPIRPLAAPAP
jgi:membrane-bound inhibitor of C-type lysozyme